MAGRNRLGVAVMSATVVFCIAQTAFADSHTASGNFEYVQVMTKDYTVVEHAQQEIIAGSLKGVNTITNSSGGPFKEGASSSLIAVVYATKSAAGMDAVSQGVLTDSDGDKRYTVAKRTAGDVSVGGGGQGGMELNGGTGKYEGIIGTCEYSADYLSEDRVVVRASCEWRRN